MKRAKQKGKVANGVREKRLKRSKSQGIGEGSDENSMNHQVFRRAQQLIESNFKVAEVKIRDRRNARIKFLNSSLQMITHRISEAEKDYEQLCTKVKRQSQATEVTDMKNKISKLSGEINFSGGFEVSRHLQISKDSLIEKLMSHDKTLISGDRKHSRRGNKC